MTPNELISIILCGSVMLFVLIVGGINFYKKIVGITKEDKQSLKQIAITLLSNEGFKSFIDEQIKIIISDIKENGVSFNTFSEYFTYLVNVFDDKMYNYIIEHYPQFSTFVTRDNIVFITDTILKICGLDNDIPEEVNFISESELDDEDEILEEDFETESDVDDFEESIEDDDILEEDFCEEDVDLEEVVDTIKDPEIAENMETVPVEEAVAEEIKPE